MTYLPELRRALVKAAERQADPAEAEAADGARAPRRARRPIGVFALMAASTVAIVVAGVVLVLVRHGSTPQPAAQSAAAPTRIDLSSAAQALFGQLTLPAGAVPSATNPAPHSQLSGVSNKLADRHTVDLHRYYVVPGTPSQVIDAISRRPPRDVQTQSGAAAAQALPASSTGRRTQPRIVFSSATFNLAPANGVDRQLIVEAVPCPGGGTALRVDAQAGYGAHQTPHAPTQTVTTPTNSPILASSGHVVVISQPAKRARVKRLLEALPTPGPVTPCRPSRATIKVVFAPNTLLVTPGCDLVTVLVEGGRTVVKTWSYPATMRTGDVRGLTRALTGG